MEELKASDGVPVAPRAERCAEIHNPGIWPFTSRCVRDTNHKKPWQNQSGQDLAAEAHMDRHGIEWYTDLRARVRAIVATFNTAFYFASINRITDELVVLIREERERAEREWNPKYGGDHG